MTKKILLAGAFIGVLDAVAACLNAYFSFGLLPQRVFQYIASGLLGKSAYQENIAGVVLGVVVHFSIAISATFIFYLIYKQYHQALRPAVLFGAVYGIWIWLFMSYVVVPSSLIGTYPSDLQQIIIGLLIHIFVIGIPIAMLVKRVVA